jgi:hypothetical protein
MAVLCIEFLQCTLKLMKFFWERTSFFLQRKQALNRCCSITTLGPELRIGSCLLGKGYTVYTNLFPGLALTFNKQQPKMDTFAYPAIVEYRLTDYRLCQINFRLPITNCPLVPINTSGRFPITISSISPTDRETDRQIDTEIGTHTDTHRNRQSDRHTDNTQKDTQTATQARRQADR